MPWSLTIQTVFGSHFDDNINEYTKFVTDKNDLE